MKKISIVEPVYFTHIRVFIGKEEEFSKFLKKEYSVDCALKEMVVGHMTELTSEEGSIYCIYLSSYDGGTYDIAVLMHEVLHVAIRHWQKIGAVIDSNNDEPFVYYTAALMEGILNKLEKK